MRRSKLTEEQILFAIKQVAAEWLVADVCRQMEISESTIYAWKKHYGEPAPFEVREHRQLRDENGRLKRLLTDLTLDRHLLSRQIVSDHIQASRPRSMHNELLPAQSPPVVRADAPREHGLVQLSTGARQRLRENGTAVTGSGSAALRSGAPSHWPQPVASAQKAGRTTSSYASTSAQGNRSAQRAGTGGRE